MKTPPRVAAPTFIAIDHDLLLRLSQALDARIDALNQAERRDLLALLKLLLAHAEATVREKITERRRDIAELARVCEAMFMSQGMAIFGFDLDRLNLELELMDRARPGREKAAWENGP